MTVKFRVLGTVEAQLGGQLVDLGPAHQQAVLVALLVDANHVVSVDGLAGRIWGDARAHRSTLYSYVSRLRNTLAGTDDIVILRRSGGYLIRVDPMAVDLHRFRHLIRLARETDDAEQAAAEYARALCQWRGEAFEGLDTQWINQLRDALEAERVAAELDYTDLELRRGRHAELLATLPAQAERRPLDERLAGQLMVALYRSGRQADALAHYQRTRRHLAEELGADPSPVLRELHQQILTADPLLAAPQGKAGGRAPVPQQLPAAPRFFTGHGPELAALTAALDCEPGATVVISALAGAGGIGKTWLALHWAHQHLDRFPDGQLFVDLRGFSPDGQPMSTGAAIRGFLDAFGVTAAHMPVEVHAQAALLRSLINGKRMLIVLDNAADTAQVTPLLPGSPTCTVLITSRNHLAGLITGHGARHLCVDVISDDEARALLTARLGAERVAAEPEAVDELLACCGGFPLALSIVAGRAHSHPGLPMARLAAELRETGLVAFEEGDPAASLPTVLSWSHQALTEEQARVFGLLGLAPGPDISLGAATSLTRLTVTGARTVLRGLEQASLLDQDRRGRYRMHDLIRRYATDRAAGELAEAEREAALRRLADFYLHTAHSAERLLCPQRQPIELASPAPGCHPHPLTGYADALAWFDTEHPCLLATQQAAAARGWHQTVWQLAWSLTTFHSRRGHLYDDLVAWQAGQVAADHLGDAATRTQAHRNLGRAYAWFGRHGKALDHLHQALTLAEHTGDRYGEAHSHRNLAQAWGAVGDDRRALLHATRALQLLQTIGSLAGEADAHNQVGWYSARLGEHDRAREHCEAALTLHRRAHDREGEAVVLDSLGYLAHRTGEHTHAIGWYQQALALFRELGHSYQAANTLDNLGYPYAALGRDEHARAAWQEALDLYHGQHREEDAERVRRQLKIL